MPTRDRARTDPSGRRHMRLFSRQSRSTCATIASIQVNVRRPLQAFLSRSFFVHRCSIIFSTSPSQALLQDKYFAGAALPRMMQQLPAVWKLPGTRQIGTDQLSAVLTATPAALLCGLVNTGIVVLDLWSVAPRIELLAWLLCSLVVTGGLYSRRGQARTREATSLSPRALRRAVLMAIVSALPWTLLGTLYLGSLPHTNELILIAICAGMSASGSILLAPVYPAALAYMAVIPKRCRKEPGCLRR